MCRSLLTVACATLMLAACAATVAAQPRDRDRPIRVGNLTVAFVGGGYGQHDHPTFDSNGFINIGYQRRILRREVRIIPLWVRGAVNFTSEERDLDDTYTYWNDPQAGRLAGVESVQERTSDFTVRLEAIADLLHTRRSALYAGAGIAVHTVHFRSRGLTSGRQGASAMPHAASVPVSRADRRVPARTTVSPRATSLPAKLIIAPGAAGRVTRTRSPSRSVSSTITTPSAPRGSTPPVAMTAACPDVISSVGAWPAPIESTTSSATGVASDAP